MEAPRWTGTVEFQIEACSSCGAEDWQVDEFGPLRRVSGWLQSGRPAPRARLTCRECGTEVLTHDNGLSPVLRLSRYHSAWWGAPIRVLRVLVHARMITPTPLIYLTAGAAGALLGLALDLTIGWSWWTVALGSVAVAWTLFLLTALKGASLWANIVDALDPQGAGARESRRMEEAFRTSPFSLYGLPPSWEGIRFLGGLGRRGRPSGVVLTELELAHGDPEDRAGVQLRVTSSVPGGEPDLPHELLLRELAEGLWWEVGSPPDGPFSGAFHEWAQAREREFRHREPPPFTPVRITVDGEPIRFDHHSEGAAWVAAGRITDVTITLRTRNLAVDDIELITVTDVEPYVEGSKLLNERWQNDHR